MQIDEDRNRWGSSLAVAILDQINLVLGCVLAAACIYLSNEWDGKWVREWKYSEIMQTPTFIEKQTNIRTYAC